ncbi:hypothetical protein [Celeribacter naphthalenivorans]|uniref:hypothetical protein n=1 Tax=Celeribacter naphthalenivorans TaxID=1614694 RepID=UPI001CFB3F49|nr:hypothetical protein [Celeribacter naphthalenivorans]
MPLIPLTVTEREGRAILAALTALQDEIAATELDGHEFAWSTSTTDDGRLDPPTWDDIDQLAARLRDLL